VLSDTAWTGTGAGTFAAIMPIYRQINDPPMSTPPNAVVALSIELGWPMVVLIVTVTLGATFTLLKASLERGRDSFYPAAGAGGLITVLFLSFINPGILGTAAAVIFAAVIGLAFAQSKSRTQ
jgi:Na+/proline symporter